MKIYVSRRDENVTAKLDEAYSNEQTVMLEYLTGDKKGKTISITHSTLKRWWKVVEVEDTMEEVDETDTNIESSTDGDSKEQAETPVEVKDVDITSESIETVVDVEYAEQAKEKAEKHKKFTGSKSVLFDLSAIIPDVKIKYVPSDKSNIRIISGDKTIAELFIRKSFIFVCTRKAVEGFDLKVKSYRPYPNYHKVTSVEQVNKIIQEVM